MLVKFPASPCSAYQEHRARHPVALARDRLVYGAASYASCAKCSNSDVAFLPGTCRQSIQQTRQLNVIIGRHTQSVFSAHPSDGRSAGCGAFGHPE